MTIKPGATLTINLELPPFCKYDAHAKDMTCPKCKKQDKVVPIVYGFPVGPLDKKHCYYAGCIISNCDPYWYCKRDKLKF